MKNKLPLIFFGSNMFSIYVLKEFINSYQPLLVLTLKGKPQGRGLKIKLNPVYEFCLKEKIPVIELKNWEIFKNQIKELGHSQKINNLTGVIASFGKIIPQEVISLFPLGIINIHPSLLPKYRGANPIRETILNGEKETGITIFLIDDKVDHGPILIQEKLKINEESYLELEEKLGKLGGKVLAQIIMPYLENKIFPKPQNDDEATYTSKINKKDGLLDPEEELSLWERKIRALNPWPGTFIYLVHKENDKEIKKILKIFQIHKVEPNNLPKEIKKIKVSSFFEWKNELGLKIKDAFIFLKEVQLEGRKKMSGREFLNGFRKIIFKD